MTTPYIPSRLVAQAALANLKLAARSAPGLLVGISIATTAVAHVPAMGEAKTNWNSLAKALEVEYPELIGNAVFISRAGWTAKDREEFLNATSVFKGDLQKLSGLCYNMESQVDSVRNAYIAYWAQIGLLAGTVLGYIAICMAMKRTAAFAVSGQMWLERLVALTNKMIARATKFLYGFLAVAGTTMAVGAYSLGQLFTIQPSGGAAINFERAVIKTDPPPTYVAPKRDEAAPPATPEST
ncbi:hypothetical protein ACIBQ1_34250 [Nonomuraea sp. NPDC050153]|uniref:hypothetical protein n=1 Tax=Nonomuraea sp. NPDC050153 TaxID=3364359 RepID=UPI00378C79F4